MKSQNRVSNHLSIVLPPKEKPIFVSYQRNVIVLWCLIKDVPPYKLVKNLNACAIFSIAHAQFIRPHPKSLC